MKDKKILWFHNETNIGKGDAVGLLFNPIDLINKTLILDFLTNFWIMKNKLQMFMVIGCPSLGFYGENCSIPCPQNCLKGLCHIEQGTCLGCQKGYRGDVCYTGN